MRRIDQKTRANPLQKPYWWRPKGFGHGTWGNQKQNAKPDAGCGIQAENQAKAGHAMSYLVNEIDKVMARAICQHCLQHKRVNQ
jgi:hypothetical protein